MMVLALHPLNRHSRESGNPAFHTLHCLKLDTRLRGYDGTGAVYKKRELTHDRLSNH
jgi:hypothetical protein